MSIDDLDSLRETLFWLQQPGIRGDLAAGEQEYGAGVTTNGSDLRTRFGLPPR